MVFAHGFGCDHHAWRFVTPYFVDEYRVITFDHVGAGGSDIAAYDPDQYSTLEGYASDVVDIIIELDLRDVILVGHSVSSMVAVLAANRIPDRIAQLVLVGPSPRYINDGDYVGGFESSDIDQLIKSLSSNFIGWSHTMAPAIMGNADRPELGEDLTESFCRYDPAIAEQFAKATFFADNRSDLIHIRQPTLILQCADDIIAPEQVGEYVHQNIAGSTLVQLEAVGHMPNLSAPEETAEAIKAFVQAINVPSR